MTVRVRDRGANALLRAARGLKEPKGVTVGILGQDGEAEESPGVTVAMVAAWAEYGLGQPERSWLRAWVDSARPAIDQRIKAETRAILEGKRDRATALARLGAWAVGQIQARIAQGIDPANAQSTIDRKGSSTPLIDKGQFRSSITSRVES